MHPFTLSPFRSRKGREPAKRRERGMHVGRTSRTRTTFRHSGESRNPEGRCKRGPSPEKVALKNGDVLRP